MRVTLVILAILAMAVQNAVAFVTSNRPAFDTGLCAKKSDVETLRKPELIAAVAEKLDTSKVGAEAAVAAVLDTIVDVSSLDVDLLIFQEEM